MEELVFLLTWFQLLLRRWLWRRWLNRAGVQVVVRKVESTVVFDLFLQLGGHTSIETLVCGGVCEASETCVQISLMLLEIVLDPY